MQGLELVVVLVPGAFLLGCLLLIAVVHRRSRRTQLPVPPLAAAVGPDGRPLPPRELPRGRWHARLNTMDRTGLAASWYGDLRLQEGWLAFFPEGRDDAQWAVPAAQVSARKHSLMTGSDLLLQAPPTGPLMVTVSTRRINRFMRNDVKELRQRGDAQQFLWLLAHSGAQVDGTS